MIDTSSKKVEDEGIAEIDNVKSDKDKLRHLLGEALNHIKSIDSTKQIIFGTQRGSIGTLIELPKKVYKVLSLLQQSIDKSNQPLDIITREDSKKVVAGKLELNSVNFIDGDNIEQFLEMDIKRQTLLL
jgi:hypothetical protein